MPPPRPEDLTEVPVYLTEVQRDIFFAPLRPLFNGPAMDGLYQCSECSEVLRCIRVCFYLFFYHLFIYLGWSSSYGESFACYAYSLFIM